MLRYEDLILRPRDTVAALAAYLGLDGDHDAMLEPLRPSPDMDDHRTSPSAERSIGRWRRDLGPELKKACEESLGGALTSFGYARLDRD